MQVLCPVSLGELIDKLSILKIKLKNIPDKTKLNHLRKEEEALEKTLASLQLQRTSEFLDELVEVNSRLWVIEDDIREKERKKEFDQKFIELARSVYIENDQRFSIKNRINEFYGSEIVEVKSYKEYE